MRKTSEVVRNISGGFFKEFPKYILLLSGFCTVQFFPPNQIKFFIPDGEKKESEIKIYKEQIENSTEKRKRKEREEEKIGGKENKSEGNISIGKNPLVKITSKNKNIVETEIEISEESSELSFRYEIVEVKKDAKILCDGSFRIPASNLRFAIIGDTSYKTGYLPYIVREIQKFSPHFVFHVGDFQYKTHFDRWDKVLEYHLPLFQNSFFYLSAGNHEYEDEEDEKELLRYFPHEGNFLFRWRNIYFAGLNIFMSKNKIESFFLNLRDFIKQRKDEEKNVLLFFIHKPFVRITIYDKIKIFNEEILKEVLSLGVDKIVIFSGHDHAYGRIKLSDKLNQIISGGGGAFLYACSLKEKKKKLDDLDVGEDIKDMLSKYGVSEILEEICVSDFHTVLCELEKNNIQCKVKSPTKGNIDKFKIPLE